MKYILLSILFLAFSTTFAQELSKKELRYKPVNLTQAVYQLKKIHHDSTQQQILEMSEEEFLLVTHRGLGMWIRNNWELWGGAELSDYFSSIGIFHPDDMSTIILRSYHRELNGREWEVDKQVEYYQDYWEKQKEHYRRLEIDTAYQNMIQAQEDSLYVVYLQKKKDEWTKGKVVTGYLPHRCGFLANSSSRTKITGRIIEWQGDKPLVHIEHYVEEKKKKRVIRCNDIKEGKILVHNHELFRLIEK